MKSAAGSVGLAIWIFASLINAPALTGAPQGCPYALEGTWGAEATFGPAVRGEITLRRSADGWRATVAGMTVNVTSEGDRLAFVLPENRGEFRGRVADRGATILAHWLQPATEHVWGGRYATPVVMRAIQPRVWRGTIRPLDDGEGIYVKIAPDSGGQLIAVVRNPERNLGRYLGPLEVTCDNLSIAFHRGNAETLRATLEPQAGVLSLYLPTETATFDLTKRSGREAVGFYPRSTADYTYVPPAPRGDGWPTAGLTDVGIDSARILRWVSGIVRTEAVGIDAPFLQAILLARHGRLVLEEYFHGYQVDRVHDVRSAAKSLTATLFGIALRSSPRLSVRQRVLAFFPELNSVANDGPQKRAMTVENLLTMTSGLAADDDDESSPGNEDRLVAQEDRVKFALDLPMASAPGESAAYSAATINLVGPIVERVSGMPLLDFIFDRFARPLDIEHYHLPIGPSGDAYMAGGFLMRPRDFMKLGQLFLSQGRWRGRRILDPSWVTAATTPHSHMTPGDYGYGWWLRDVRVGSRSYRTYRAAGNGGQLVIVIPDLDVVVAFMGGNYNQGPIWWTWNDVFIPEVIIPAVTSSQPPAAR